MVNIELNEYSAEDWKLIQELKALGMSDEDIQVAYDNTQEKRKAKEKRYE